MGRAPSFSRDDEDTSPEGLIDKRIGTEAYKNVKIVADNIDAIQNVSDNMETLGDVDNIINQIDTHVETVNAEIDAKVATATTKASEAAASATAADTAKTAAQTAKTGADTAKADAEAAKTAAQTSATNAANSATAAATDRGNAQTAAAAAAQSAAEAQAIAGGDFLAKGGGQMTGKLKAVAPSAAQAGLNIGYGPDPDVGNRINGDIWSKAGGLFAYYNNATYRLATADDIANKVDKIAGFNAVFMNAADGSVEIGRYLDFHYPDPTDGLDYRSRISIGPTGIMDVIAAGFTLNGTNLAQVTDITWGNLTGKPATFAPSAHTHTIAEITSLQGTLDAKMLATARGAANGVAPLGADSKVPTANLPDAVLGALKYQGTWNAATNSPGMQPASAGNKGYYFVVSVAGGTLIGGYSDWEIGDWVVSDGVNWQKIDNSDKVSSVAGKTGAVNLVKGDVGLGNVDNTSDVNKPVSTAQQAALDTKRTWNVSKYEIANTATVTVNFPLDLYTVLGLAQAVNIANPTGAGDWADSWSFVVRLKDNGTSRAISYGSKILAADGVTLPTATTVGKCHELAFTYNYAFDKFICISAVTYF